MLLKVATVESQEQEPKTGSGTVPASRGRKGPREGGGSPTSHILIAPSFTLGRCSCKRLLATSVSPNRNALVGDGPLVDKMQHVVSDVNVMASAVTVRLKFRGAKGKTSI